MTTLFMRKRRVSGFWTFDNPQPSSPTTESMLPGKGVRRASSLRDHIKPLVRPKSLSIDGDPSISFPWNFQHTMHVDEHMNGLPASWSAQLAEDGKSASKPEKNRHSLAALERESTRVDACLPLVKPLWCQRRNTVSGDGTEEPQISGPWNVQHNMHVDEHYNGLPPAWAMTMSKAPAALLKGDPSITLPWNFKHQIHVHVGLDGIPRGIPPSLHARLSEMGFSEDEIAAIRAHS
ncbi:uncharacterized protein LAESUDRAFT_729322 [Laetiporus sulphureus 93-53]|uniref:CRIB domain-containing protein n=1 Tax=Laetiporus sulphureus 93-53 TaxID=1314785 RepID=A0A165CRB0_9APHY|nr:uncharacterized protein LAESUDRAFT_729322 [Laetiporus sulphureus 93-53]KZT03287.1 hypothetical protein LAESUDRAFT_729322 [Laetiporus sulphureus 93-53]